MLALYAVSSLIVLPLTCYRAGYSISVGYGLSISTMSLLMLLSFPYSSSFPSMHRDDAILHLHLLPSPPRLVACISLLYGLRLSSFIYWRERNVVSKRRQFDTLEEKWSMTKRTPLALSVSLLYVCMSSPALFALRREMADGTTTTTTTTGGGIGRWTGTGFALVALVGLVLETIADMHKYEAKRGINARREVRGGARGKKVVSGRRGGQRQRR